MFPETVNRAEGHAAVRTVDRPARVKGRVPGQDRVGDRQRAVLALDRAASVEGRPRRGAAAAGQRQAGQRDRRPVDEEACDRPPPLIESRPAPGPTIVTSDVQVDPRPAEGDRPAQDKRGERDRPAARDDLDGLAEAQVARRVVPVVLVQERVDHDRSGRDGLGLDRAGVHHRADNRANPAPRWSYASGRPCGSIASAARPASIAAVRQQGVRLRRPPVVPQHGVDEAVGDHADDVSVDPVP